MARYTSLGVGGAADAYLEVTSRDDLAAATCAVQRAGSPHMVLGGGSNICMSDAGFRGLVIHNRADECNVGPLTQVASGCPVIALFLQSLRSSLSGLEFAVGIPGSVGGALASNAGAYRENLGALVRSLDVTERGARRTVGAGWMAFGYRDSRLRREPESSVAVIGVTLELRSARRRDIVAKARENQRQRISRQPWRPSAGSFFKNVQDPALAASVAGLSDDLRAKGIVPAGLLISQAGCRGLRLGGAGVSRRHGNFLINIGAATASDVRSLADLVRMRVLDAFGVRLQEEVIYVGDWTAWTPEGNC